MKSNAKQIPLSQAIAVENDAITCYNACKEINPKDPAKAAVQYGHILAALLEARIQIEYLQQKFSQTGSGNAVLNQIKIQYEAATGKKIDQ